MAAPSGTFTTLPGSVVTTIEGTDGTDVLGGLKFNENLRINGRGDVDHLTINAKNGGTFNNISVYGNAGADTITTTSTVTGSLIQGGGGGDLIHAISGNTDVTVRGGSGNDKIYGTVGGNNLILNGNKNNDTMYIGNTFINSGVYGGEGNDIINVQHGILNNSSIFGDKGDDLITDQGADIVLDLQGTTSGVFGNAGADTITFAATTTSITAQGGAGNDTMTGGTAADTLNGGADNDELTGGGGADDLKGSAGNDVFKYATAASFLTGNAVVDLIDGGADSDSIEVAAVLDIGTNDVLTRVTTTETLKQTAVGASDIDIDTNANLGSIRELDYSANTAADVWVFTGITNAVDLTLKVGAGANDVTSGAGADSIVSLGGNDTLLGAAGNDTIDAGAGTDSITGGAGNDNITGGTGVDTFVIASSADAGASEIYADFVEGDAGDVFKLTKSTLKGGAAVNSDGASVLDLDTTQGGKTATDSTDVIALIGASYASTTALLTAVNGNNGISEANDGDLDNDTIVAIFNDDDGADAGTYLVLLTGDADFGANGFASATLLAKLGATAANEVTDITAANFTIAG